MLLGVRFVILDSAAIFQLPFTTSCSGMLSFVFACFDMVAYTFRLATISCGFLKQVLFVLACGAFRIRFAICCCCLFPFSSVCCRLFASLRSGACLHRLLVGSEVTVVFVGVSCDEPSANC